MLHIFFVDVFDAKIIHNERKSDGPGFMLPQAWRILTGIVPMRSEIALQLFIS